MRISRKILLFATIAVASVACGETNQPLSPDTAAPRLAITGLSIQGPSAITRWEECTFRAVASGGTAPYTYTWSVQNGQGTADGIFWTGSTWTTVMTLTVTATDALGAKRTFSKNVAGVYDAPPCV